MKTKKCSRCEKEKSLNEFHQHKGNPDGLRYYCKDCRKECNKKYWKKYYQKNKDKVSKRNKEYREENSEKVKKQQKKHIKMNIRLNLHLRMNEDILFLYSSVGVIGAIMNIEEN